jgi:hypothetical protein
MDSKILHKNTLVSYQICQPGPKLIVIPEDTCMKPCHVRHHYVFDSALSSQIERLFAQADNLIFFLTMSYTGYS